jgi:hypothetical protein
VEGRERGRPSHRAQVLDRQAKTAVFNNQLFDEEVEVEEEEEVRKPVWLVETRLS